MSDNPWMKFYPRDWRGDQSLRAVSIAARGLWMECLCIMHEAKPYGHLLLNGEPVGDNTLARMTGASVDEVSALLAELRQAGVFSVNRDGIIVSRRMTKDHARASKGRKAIKKRWSQDIEKNEENGVPNRSPNRNPITQKPEARGKKEEAKASSKKPSGDSGRGARLDPGWQPDDELIRFARDAGLPPSQIALEADKFRDYWLSLSGSKATKLDWGRTWKNWIRNAQGSKPAAESTSVAATPKNLSDHEWSSAMRRWVDTGEWLADWLCPPPDQPGCMAPDGMLRHAAKVLPEKAAEIEINLKQRKAA